MPVIPEIQFQISLVNIMSPGAAQQQAQELEKLLQEQTTVEKR